MIVLVETIKSCKQFLYQDKGTMPKERQCSLYLSPQWRRGRSSTTRDVTVGIVDINCIVIDVSKAQRHHEAHQHDDTS